MITAAIFLNSSAAHGTKRNFCRIFFYPALKLSIRIFFTRDVFSMPHIAAFEAHFCGTLWTYQLRLLLAFGTNMTRTTRFWAKSHKQVLFK